MPHNVKISAGSFGATVEIDGKVVSCRDVRVELGSDGEPVVSLTLRPESVDYEARSTVRAEGRPVDPQLFDSYTFLESSWRTDDATSRPKTAVVGACDCNGCSCGDQACRQCCAACCSEHQTHAYTNARGESEPLLYGRDLSGTCQVCLAAPDCFHTDECPQRRHQRLGAEARRVNEAPGRRTTWYWDTESKQDVVEDLKKAVAKLKAQDWWTTPPSLSLSYGLNAGKTQKLNEAVDAMLQGVYVAADGTIKKIPGLVPALKTAKCTCGTDASGGGLHSDWCDKAGGT